MTDEANAARPWPAPFRGLADLAHRVFRGESPQDLVDALVARLTADPGDAGAWLDLGMLHELGFNKELGLACQGEALKLQRVYRITAPKDGPGLRLLMFAAPGDIATNVPVSFLLLDSDVTLDVVFIVPGEPLPDEVPDHDLVLVGACESEANKPVLDILAAVLPEWPRPFLLHPAGIQSMERDNLWKLMRGAPGVFMPPTIQMRREEVAAIPSRDAEYPFLLRPIDTHAGQGLEKIDAPADVTAYLEKYQDQAFFCAPFVDYRGPDGLYRKHRVAMLDGKPYLGHMATADHWMLHYLNAGMDKDAGKREKEAEAFSTFDAVFAVKHGPALQALYERTGKLEYITLDCGETRDGDLLIFEAGTAMVIHDMDPAEVFPYKLPNMQKIFRAFRELLQRHATAH